jgi:hypothetical protein
VPSEEAKNWGDTGDPEPAEEEQVGPTKFDFQVGGRERFGHKMHDTTYRYDATHYDIVPDQRLVCTYEMYADDVRISVSLTTVEFARSGDGTTLTWTEQGAYRGGFDGPEAAALRKGGTARKRRYVIDRGASTWPAHSLFLASGIAGYRAPRLGHDDAELAPPKAGSPAAPGCRQGKLDLGLKPRSAIASVMRKRSCELVLMAHRRPTRSWLGAEVRVIVMYLGAAFLVLCSALCLYGGIGGQPRGGGHALRQVSTSRPFGPLIVMGIALLFGACLCLGDAISVRGTKSNAGLVLMAIGAVGLMPTALLFCSLRLFGRPKFLMPQNTRSPSGPWRSRQRSARADQPIRSCREPR